MYNVSDMQKSRLRNYIIFGARNYSHFLINKTFMVVCNDGTTATVRFFLKDFQHLTGLVSNLNELDFYRRCVYGTIDEGNIKTEQKYNWATLRSKGIRIAKIHELLYKSGEKTLLLECLETHTRTFPCAIKNDDSNVDICVGFAGSVNKARSLRKATKSTTARDTKKIIAIFAKSASTHLYNELIYMSNVRLLYEKNPNIINMLSPRIAEKISVIIGCNS